MSDAPLKLGATALHGGLVTGTAQVVKIGLQLLSIVVLARLLLPEDFGLVASVAPIIAFITLFQDLGLQQAVIQKQDISNRQLNQVFWVMGLVGVISVVIVVATAPAAATFYRDPRITMIAIAATLPLFFGSLTAMPISLMTRNLKFTRLAVNDVLAAAFGFFAAIAAAYQGLGYWALIIGTAVTSFVLLVATWIAARWIPDLPDLKLDRQILSFGANLTGFNLVNFFSRNLDNILIGRFSGAVELGYYDRAYKLILFPLQNINQPLSRVMIPLLSRIQTDKTRFRDVYMQTNWVLAAIMIPGIAALTMTSDQVISLLFGSQWAASAPIFAWLGLAGLVQPVSSTTGWIFICQGKTKSLFRWGLWSSSVTVVAFIIGMQWGAVGVAAAYAISSYTFRVPGLAFLLHRIGPVSAFDYLGIHAVFLGSSLLAWFVFETLPETLTGASGPIAIIMALGLSYTGALIATAMIPPSRRAILATITSILQSRKSSLVPQAATDQ